MTFSHIKAVFALTGILILTGPVMAQAEKISTQSGKILLDVERKGEAWYVDPVSSQRVFLANGAVAHEVLREYGLGISNADLEKIPVGFIPVLQNPEDLFNELEPMFAKCDPSSRDTSFAESLATFKAAVGIPVPLTMASHDVLTEDEKPPVWTGADALCLSSTIRELVVTDKHIPFIRAAMQSVGTMFSDGDEDRIGYTDESEFGTSPWESDTDADGHQDGTEIEAGFSPLGAGNMKVDQALVNRLKGRILLQVEGVGQAWYVHPETGRRYYLATGADAYRLMSRLGVGASSHIIDGIASESESFALYQSVSGEGVPCEGTQCFEDGIAADVRTRAVLTFEPSVTLPDAMTSSGSVRVLAQYISGIKKDYVSFELIQISGGTIKGNEIIDLMASNEILPEGMTTEEKAQLAEDIEVTYAHLLVDIVNVVPRLTCVIKDRAEFLTEWKLINGAIQQSMSSDFTTEDSWMETEDAFDGAAAELEESSTSCSWQGGAL